MSRKIILDLMIFCTYIFNIKRRATARASTLYIALRGWGFGANHFYFTKKAARGGILGRFLQLLNGTVVDSIMEDTHRKYLKAKSN